MKNSTTAILVAVTLAFAAFVGGFCLGRNTAGGQIQLSAFYETGSSTAPTSFAPTTTAALLPTTQSPTESDITVQETTVPIESVFPININTATLEQLDLIPGIGPVYAQRILDLRSEIGQFRHIEELLDVKGIGEKTLEKIKPYITIEGGNP